MAKFENDLSKGNVVKQLIIFALPFLLSNLIQTLYSVVDMIVVGQYAGPASMSGVNIGSQVTFLITNMVFGLSVGATVLIAQYLGAGNRKALKETIGTLLSTLIVLAVVITISMIALQEPLLRLIQTPAEAFNEAKEYFFITMLGTIFIFGYNALSAIMRGMGDSKNPLVFVAIACVINIILDLWLVKGLQMKAAGAALATVISQAVSMILCIMYLVKNKFIFDFKLSSFAFHKKRLKLLLKIGIPTSVQNVAVSASFLFLTALVNSLGVIASAAVGAVGKLNGFAILPAVAMSSSISAMAAQNIGAGEIERAKKTMYTGMAIAAGISIVVFAAFNMWPEALLRIFGDDEEMIRQGVVYIRALGFDYLIAPLVFCFNGLFIGSGHTTFSFFNSCISSLLGRIPASYILGMTFNLGLFGFGLGAPIASFVALVLAFGYYLSGNWRKMTIIK